MDSTVSAGMLGTLAAIVCIRILVGILGEFDLVVFNPDIFAICKCGRLVDKVLINADILFIGLVLVNARARSYLCKMAACGLRARVQRQVAQ